MPEVTDTGSTARCLMRAARQASLATLADGAPFVSLVTRAVSCGGDLLMLVSGLSRHGRHLRQDGRCALLLHGEAQAANPQAAPRLTVTGTAEPVQDAASRDRWVRIHPYGASYAAFADFALWRLRPEQAHYIAGFGQVRSLPAPGASPSRSRPRHHLRSRPRHRRPSGRRSPRSSRGRLVAAGVFALVHPGAVA